MPVVDDALEELQEEGLSAVLCGGETDVPALLAMLLGLFLGHTSAAAVILLMVTGGEALEEYALDRAGNALHSLLD